MPKNLKTDTTSGEEVEISTDTTRVGSPLETHVISSVPYLSPKESQERSLYPGNSEVPLSDSASLSPVRSINDVPPTTTAKDELMPARCGHDTQAAPLNSACANTGTSNDSAQKHSPVRHDLDKEPSGNEVFDLFEKEMRASEYQKWPKQPLHDEHSSHDKSAKASDKLRISATTVTTASPPAQNPVIEAPVGSATVCQLPLGVNYDSRYYERRQEAFERIKREHPEMHARWKEHTGRRSPSSGRI